MSSHPKKILDTFFFIPHTHWEGAVFKTREGYLEMGLSNILRALQLLKTYPAYRFVLDQACYVKPFLERYPEEEPSFRQSIAEGRLAIAGGLDVMPDANMPGGESFVRQALYGKRYFREKLGLDVSVGWQLDTFGHHAQVPQLMKLCGYQSFWFFRGVPDWNTPSEFIWEGLDGTRIPAFWLPFGYALTYGSPKSLPEFTAFMRQAYESLDPFTRGNSRVGLAGADVCEPEDHIPDLVEAFNRQEDRPFNLKIALPADYEAAIEAQSSAVERPVIRGELNPIFQGTYSSRIELKQLTREIEGLLTTAEKLGVLLGWCGKPADDDFIWKAWEPALFNQTHDLMSGVMTDAVYEDTLQSYAFSRRLAAEEVQTRLQSLIGMIDTGVISIPGGERTPGGKINPGGEKTPLGEVIPLVVFNPSGWTRSDVAIANVGFSGDDVLDLKLLDPSGRPERLQILDAERYPGGGLIRARIAFIAGDVPPVGYSIYHLVGLKSAPEKMVEWMEQEANTFENEWYVLEFDPGTGAITRLVRKQDGWNILSAPGNVIAMQEDQGDFWELYRALDGGSRIAMKEKHAPPRAGQAVFSTDQRAADCKFTRGPVFSEVTVSHLFSTAGQFQTTIRLYASLGRIDISTRILNQDRFVRYRALFPTGQAAGQIFREIPFGASQQPDGIEFPAQTWIDLGDSERGVALLNRGLPGCNAADGTLMLSLMRSTAIVAYGFGGGYEPGMSSDTGFELGKTLTFDYALIPHPGSWQEARIFQEGSAFNNPLIASPAASHPGSLPTRWGPLEINRPNIVLSAFKTGKGGKFILRLYEASGIPTKDVKVRFTPRVTSARDTNLIEDAGQPLEVVDHSLRLDFGGFEIKTIELL